MMASLPLCGMAQSDTSSVINQKVAPNNWYQLDRNTTGYYGISLDKAYDFLKGKQSHQVLVGVIDSGVDTLQPDLKSILWHNPGEIPGNSRCPEGSWRRQAPSGHSTAGPARSPG